MTAVRHNRPARWLLIAGAACGALLTGFRSRTTGTPPRAVTEIQEELRAFRVFATVLHVGAHPDDENTQLIAYLSRGRAYRTAYLSVTRGDGGQNLLGPQLGEKLGVARTQELLAARRIDGGRQFFTTALDFGYSKDVKEALSTWDHQQVLSDVVRVIRTFRPDVIITRFPTVPSNTHGHHTASAVLALEAFKLAGDPKAFPEQLAHLKTWQPKRIFMNGGNGPVSLDIGGNDPVSGETFAAMAARSRAMHKTQGFGQGGAAGGGGGGGGRGAGGSGQPMTLLAGDPATNDVMDGIDTTWNRIPGGAGIGAEASDILAHFNASDPSASVPDLLNLRKHVAALAAKVGDPVVDEKRLLLDRILEDCLGLHVATTLQNVEVVPGEAFTMRHVVSEDSRVAIRWLGVRYPGEAAALVGPPVDIKPGVQAARAATMTLPAKTPLTQPYWLRREATAGNFQVDDQSLIGRPENPPAYPLEFEFEIAGQSLIVSGEPVQARVCTGECPPPRHMDVIAPVALKFTPDVGVFTPGTAHTVTVSITAARPAMNGTLKLEVPAGWRVSPAVQPFRLVKASDSATYTFSVTSPGIATASIFAQAQVSGVTYGVQRVAIDYPHIPLPQLLQPAARLRAVSLNLATRGHKVGYLPGAGDDLVPAMQQMGYDVTTLAGSDVTPEKLRGFDAVVLGIRVFNVRTDLATVMPALFAYADAGGTVIVQYSQNTGIKSNAFAPYPLQISAERVTDEHAKVTVPRAGSSGGQLPEQDYGRRFHGLGAGTGDLLPDLVGPAFLRRSWPAAIQGKSPSRAGCWWPIPGRAIGSIPGWYFSVNFPPAYPARIDSSPTCCRSDRRRRRDHRRTRWPIPS